MWGSVCELADSHGLSVYDAAYLELAQRLRLQLATREKGLLRAGSAIGITVI